MTCVLAKEQAPEPVLEIAPLLPAPVLCSPAKGTKPRPAPVPSSH